MKFLLTSDLHLTDLPRDKYRFGVFPWLRQQQEKYDVDATLILGDLTDAKDKHSAALVNSVVDGLKLLKSPVYIPMGNHDYLNPEMPFFYFLDHMNIWFCNKPTLLDDLAVYLIPHQSSQAALDNAFKRVPEGWLVMCHQTFTGAKNEHGGLLGGFTLPPEAKRAKAIYSGDVHVPQILHCPNGDVTYIGSPWHCRFGDQFDPRVLLSADDKICNLYFKGSPRKVSVTVRDISEMPRLNKGDQVKVTLELARSEAVEWQNYKQAILDHCKELDVEVYGVDLKLPEVRRRPSLEERPIVKKSNADYFSNFCAIERISGQIKQAGLDLIGGNK